MAGSKTSRRLRRSLTVALPGLVLAGAGSFRTPSLGGTFQLAPPHDGEQDCMTEPVTRAMFVAQALLVRARPPQVERPDPAR